MYAVKVALENEHWTLYASRTPQDSGRGFKISLADAALSLEFWSWKNWSGDQNFCWKKWSPGLASFPGPAQLFVACSTEKRGEPGIFSHVSMM